MICFWRRGREDCRTYLLSLHKAEKLCSDRLAVCEPIPADFNVSTLHPRKACYLQREFKSRENPEQRVGERQQAVCSGQVDNHDLDLKCAVGCVDVSADRSEYWPRAQPLRPAQIFAPQAQLPNRTRTSPRCSTDLRSLRCPP